MNSEAPLTPVVSTQHNFPTPPTVRLRHQGHVWYIEDLTQEKFSLQRALEASKTLGESLYAENSSLTESYNQQLIMESSNSNQADQQFGSDHLWEIFSRMPAKAVIKFSSLSKSLSTLVSEPLFVERQSIHSSVLDGGYFLKPDNHYSDNLEFNVLPCDGNQPSTFGIPDNSLSFLTQNGSVLRTSSHGLLLLLKNNDDGILICNPAMRSWAPLPLPKSLDHYSPNGILLECHPTNLKNDTGDYFCSDYTITVPILPDVVDDPSGCLLAVYRNGKWEEEMCDLRIEKRQLRVGMPVGLFRGDNGGLVIHYMCDSLLSSIGRPMYREPYVVAYDIQKKAFTRKFSLPKGAWRARDDASRLNKLKMFKWRSSNTICLVRIDNIIVNYDDKGSIFTVWVLEHYMSGLWRMVVMKETSEMGVLNEGVVQGCCVANGNSLVFAMIRRVYMYTMEGVDAGKLELVGEHDCPERTRMAFTLYSNTLRPVCGGESNLCTF